MRRLFAGLLAWIPCSVACAQVPALDFGGVDAALARAPVRVMVLGSDHLSRRADEIDQSHVDPLLDRLEGFAPDVIAIEATSGQVCEMLRLYEASYPGVAAQYCIDPGPARASLGVSGPEAEAKAAAMLADWPEAPSPAQRRRLAALFYAAGEPYSAVVQWLRLPPEARKADDGIDDALLALIEARAASLNENASIAARLAARMGHERVIAADDRSADDILAGYGDAFWAYMRPIWDANANGINALFDAAQADLDQPGRLLAYYRFLNDPETQRLNVEADFLRALQDPGDEAYGQQYAAWWQARGLRMAANVVEAAAGRPGTRVLVTVGSSHKPYYEAYLDQMHDVELVGTDTVLGGKPAR